MHIDEQKRREEIFLPGNPNTARNRNSKQAVACGPLPIHLDPSIRAWLPPFDFALPPPQWLPLLKSPIAIQNTTKAPMLSTRSPVLSVPMSRSRGTFSSFAVVTRIYSRCQTNEATVRVFLPSRCPQLGQTVYRWYEQPHCYDIHWRFVPRNCSALRNGVLTACDRPQA